MAVQLAKNNAVTYVCVCLAKYILEMTILLQKNTAKFMVGQQCMKLRTVQFFYRNIFWQYWFNIFKICMGV